MKTKSKQEAFVFPKLPQLSTARPTTTRARASEPTNGVNHLHVVCPSCVKRSTGHLSFTNARAVQSCVIIIERWLTFGQASTYMTKQQRGTTEQRPPTAATRSSNGRSTCSRNTRLTRRGPFSERIEHSEFIRSAHVHPPLSIVVCGLPARSLDIVPRAPRCCSVTKKKKKKN